MFMTTIDTKNIWKRLNSIWFLLYIGSLFWHLIIFSNMDNLLLWGVNELLCRKSSWLFNLHLDFVKFKLDSINISFLFFFLALGNIEFYLKFYYGKFDRKWWIKYLIWSFDWQKLWRPEKHPSLLNTFSSFQFPTNQFSRYNFEWKFI